MTGSTGSEEALHPVGCEGAPRAQGLDQGRACASAIRDWLHSRGLRTRPRMVPTLRRLAGGPTLGAGVGREVIRHYPHMGERMSGIAREARVPLESLMEDVVASAYGVAGHPLSAPAPVLGIADADGAVLGRAFAPETPWIVRRSRPEVGFPSIEITLPWLAGAVAGINDSGVSVVIGSPVAAPIERGLAAAPAWMLAQDCLQRFVALDASLEWCLRRPSGGDFTLLLGDASGEFAVIDSSAEGCQLRERGMGPLVAGGSTEAQSSLDKRIALGGTFGADWLADEGIGGEQASQVWLRPSDGILEWRAPGKDARVVRARG